MVAALERTAYHNSRFVPGHFVDYTAGYDSECAVLFPETVSLAVRPTNNFATIFCDREARRLQNCASQAAGRGWGLGLFLELELWLGSLPLIEDTVALWDLIHDASHSVGELPFDPFMIRQRAPFWMYGLEELRVDLRSFEEAARLAGQGFPFARYVTWAILLDRVLRFPIAGTRIRNYDALGGQLLFAYLHQHDILLWRDNHLTIDWSSLGRGIRGLREIELTSCCGRRTDRTARLLPRRHKLISYVRPNVASQLEWRRASSRTKSTSNAGYLSFTRMNPPWVTSTSNCAANLPNSSWCPAGSGCQRQASNQPGVSLFLANWNWLPA